MRFMYLYSLQVGLFLVFLFFYGFESAVWANVGEVFGFGSRTGALAGSAVASGFDSYAAYTNPAGLGFSVSRDRKASLGIGFIYMEPRFISIDNVYVENQYVSDKDRIGSVDTIYQPTFGQSLGASFQISEQRHWALGVVTYLPANQAALIDTGEAYHPEYLLYRARTQRPQVEVGVGGELTPALYFGAGMHLAFSITANANVFLNSDPNKPSTMRFSSSIKPKASPYFGLLWKPLRPSQSFLLGTVIRLPATSDVSLALNSGARLFGTLAALDFNFTALSTLLYDPLTIQMGSSWEHAPGWRFHGQFDYLFWNKLRSPALQIQSPDITSCSENSGACGFAISPGKNPIASFQNVLIPRIAEEVNIGKTVVRFGYSYQPSLLAVLPTGAGNDLDPPQHILTAGVGIPVDHFLRTSLSAKVDINAAYHSLNTQHITKTSGNEGGISGDYKIGAPGYDAGGKIFGGGVSLSLSI